MGQKVILENKSLDEINLQKVPEADHAINCEESNKSKELLKKTTLNSIEELNSFTNGSTLQWAQFKNINSLGFISNDGLVLDLPWSNDFGWQLLVDDNANGPIKYRNKSNGNYGNFYEILSTRTTPVYIVESGTATGAVSGTGSNIAWTYRKYNNGISECWGNTTSIRSSSSWGNMYYATGADPVWTYPSSLFINTPNCFINYTSSIWCFTGYNGTGSKDKTPNSLPVSAVSYSNTTFTVFIHAIGTWK